jgi:DNA-binding transcriptional LysR family regulator
LLKRAGSERRWLYPAADAQRPWCIQFTEAASIEASPLSTIRLLFGCNDRLALLTRFDYEHEGGAGGLTVLPFAVIEPALPVGIIKRAKWTPTPLHAQFFDLIRSHAAFLTPQGLLNGKAA